MARTNRNPIGQVGHHHRHGAVVHEPPEGAQSEIEVHRERSAERNDGEQQQRGNERHGRRQEEEPPVGQGRKGLFLEDVLEAVRRRLQQTGRAHPVGAAPVLHPGADLPLHQGQQRHAHHGHGEHHQHLDDAEEQEPLHFRRHDTPTREPCLLPAVPANRRALVR